jgi:hypothetical protein
VAVAFDSNLPHDCRPMSVTVSSGVTDADIERIARRVVELLKATDAAAPVPR